MPLASSRMAADPLIELVADWIDDPVLFVRQALGVEDVEDWQAQVLRDLVKHDRIAIRSGHGVGKSALMAWVILWFLFTRYPAKIPCTAPTAHQLYDVLWSELGRWHRNLCERLPWLGQRLSLGADRLAWAEAPTEVFAAARTARRESPEALQGFHSDNLLFLIDEASGVDDIVFEVAGGALSTPGAKILMAGNPTRNTGYFHRAFHADRGRWRTFAVPCSASSRVDPAYIADMAERYGEDSDIYRVRVQGEFPNASALQFIPSDIVAYCRQYKAESYQDQPRILGVDVARFGDDQTVLLIRQGRKVLSVARYRGLDTMHVADMVIECMQVAKVDAVVVDGVGIGAGVVDRLRQLGHRRITDFQAGGSANDPKTYANRRAEVWGLMREALRVGVELPDDRELLDDLVAPEYGFTPKQQIQLERKEDMKKRGLASPDAGDALSLTFAIRPAATLRSEAGKRVADSDYDPFNT